MAAPSTIVLLCVVSETCGTFIPDWTPILIIRKNTHTHTPSLATPVNGWDWFEVWPRACWAHFFCESSTSIWIGGRDLKSSILSLFEYTNIMYTDDRHHRTKCHVVAIKYPNTIEIHLSVTVGMPFNHKHEIMRCIWAYAAVSNHVQSALTTRT